MSDDAPVFDQYGSLPGNLVPPSKQAMKFAGYFLDVGTQQFNWVAYKDAIDNRPDTDMIIEQYENNRIAQQENTVEDMCNKTGDFLAKVGGPVFDKDAMVERVTNAFTGLQQQEDSGCAWYQEEGDNTAVTYRIIITVPNKHLPSDFYSLVSTIKLRGDLSSKSAWFGLDRSSRHNFSAEVDVMKLAVNENFVAGPKPPM
ncbi:delta-endotoxin CytB [Rhizoctonia solani]|nr:delta-endotoxin CytB [Rhizoctonia solani]